MLWQKLQMEKKKSGDANHVTYGPPYKIDHLGRLRFQYGYEYAVCQHSSVTSRSFQPSCFSICQPKSWFWNRKFDFSFRDEVFCRLDLNLVSDSTSHSANLGLPTLGSILFHIFVPATTQILAYWTYKRIDQKERNSLFLWWRHWLTFQDLLSPTPAPDM